MEVVAEIGWGSISKVHVSNRRKKDLQSKYAVAFAEFLELQTWLLGQHVTELQRVEGGIGC